MRGVFFLLFIIKIRYVELEHKIWNPVENILLTTISVLCTINANSLIKTQPTKLLKLMDEINLHPEDRPRMFENVGIITKLSTRSFGVRLVSERALHKFFESKDAGKLPSKYFVCFHL